MKNLALGIIFSLFISIGSIASVSANVPGGKKKKKCCKTEMKDCSKSEKKECKSEKKEKKSCCPSKSESKDCGKKSEAPE